MTRNPSAEVAAKATESIARDPLFIIGTGRCGSTVFHDLFAYHPQLTWLTALANRYPRRLQRNSKMVSLVGLPGVGRLVRQKFAPVEAWPMWEHYFRGFSAPCRDLTAADAFPYAVSSLRSMARSCVTRGRPQLLCKITGWPRIGFLHAVFPNAKFINVIRDGRAVASSLLRVKFWLGWRGPEAWTMGPLSAEQNERWQKYDRSFVALAALEWEILMDAYERAKHSIPADRLMEIRYENLCADPLGQVRAATEFAGLPWSAQLERNIALLPLTSQNDKWKQGLSPAQQEILTDCLRPSLAHWGYRA